MTEELLKAIPVFFASMLKFILGPVGGYSAGLSMITTMIVTVAGMMTSVLAFTYFGDWLRDKVFHRFIKNKNSNTERRQKFKGLWKKYGIAGVAALSPIILTPIGGTLIAISFGTPKKKLILYMLASAIFWSVVFSSLIYLVGKEILPDFIR